MPKKLLFSFDRKLGKLGQPHELLSGLMFRVTLTVHLQQDAPKG
jgi:hypothetical protein